MFVNISFMKRQVQITSFLKRGATRKKVFLSITGQMTPTEIMSATYGKKSETYRSSVSRALSELEKEGLVEELTNYRIGRLYRLTKLGQKIKRTLF